MRAGITTSRGWLGFNLHDGKLSVGLIPRRGFTIDVKMERVLRDMTAGKNDVVTVVKMYAQHWWSLGRPMPWTIIRRARQYVRWQKRVEQTMTPPPWPFGDILDDPDPRASVRI